MYTHTQGEVSLSSLDPWPREFFTRPRKFNRDSENTPYIEFLKGSLEDENGLEEDENEDGEEEDGSVDGTDEDGPDSLGMENMNEIRKDEKKERATEVLGNVKLFMNGMHGDEDMLEYLDQVEQVAGFSEQPIVREFEKCGALLDDRSNGGSKLDTQGSCRPYVGPLTPYQLRYELSKKRFRGELDENSPIIKFERDQVDAERRLVFITDLNPLSIEAIASTAPRSHATALRNLFYRYITGKSSIGVTIPSHGFRVFTLEFHICYFVLRASSLSLEDRRRTFRGTPLRQSLDLPFLSPLGTASNPNLKSFYRLYEAQISVAVTGIDHWVWTAYGFIDTYYGSKESVQSYDLLKGPMAWPDPLAAGQILANSLIWTPREYFFRILEIRINQVRREWRAIFAKMESEIKLPRTKHVFPLLSNDAKARQEVRDSSVWSFQVVGLLRLLISSLSESVDAWEEFCRRDIGYFSPHGSSPKGSATLQSSVGSVDRAFSDLRLLRRKLIDLKNELCENNHQGLNAHLALSSHEAAIYQQGTSRNIHLLTVIIIMFSPLVLATSIFSTQGVLPFTPNLARFAYLFIVLMAFVAMTSVILHKWSSWFQPSIECFTTELKSRIRKLGDQKRSDPEISQGIDLSLSTSSLMGDSEPLIQRVHGNSPEGDSSNVFRRGRGPPRPMGWSILASSLTFGERLGSCIRQAWTLWCRFPVQEGSERIEWLCGCGTLLYVDLPNASAEDADIIREIVSKLTGNNGTPSAPVDLGSELRSFIPPPARALETRASTANIQQTQPTGNDLSSNLRRNTAGDLIIPMRLGEPGVLRTDTKYLALCVNTGKYSKVLGEIEITPEIDTDLKLFKEIKRRYLGLRKFRAKFQLHIPIAVHYVYISIYNRNQVGILDGPLSLPPRAEVEGGRYHYKPCPWEGGKPVPDHIFMHMLNCPDPLGVDVWTSRLPKKMKTSITHGANAMSYGWGVHIVEGPNWALIAWLNIIALILTGFIAALWIYYKKDYQSAFGFACWIIAVFDSLLTVYFFKWKKE